MKETDSGSLPEALNDSASLREALNEDMADSRIATGVSEATITQRTADVMPPGKTLGDIAHDIFRQLDLKVWPNGTHHAWLTGLLAMVDENASKRERAIAAIQAADRSRSEDRTVWDCTRRTRDGACPQCGAGRGEHCRNEAPPERPQPALHAMALQWEDHKARGRDERAQPDKVASLAVLLREAFDMGVMQATMQAPRRPEAMPKCAHCFLHNPDGVRGQRCAECADCDHWRWANASIGVICQDCGEEVTPPTGVRPMTTAECARYNDVKERRRSRERAKTSTQAERFADQLQEYEQVVVPRLLAETADLRNRLYAAEVRASVQAASAKHWASVVDAQRGRPGCECDDPGHDGHEPDCEYVRSHNAVGAAKGAGSFATVEGERDELRTGVGVASRVGRASPVDPSGSDVASPNAGQDESLHDIATRFTRENMRDISESSTSTIKFRAALGRLLCRVYQMGHDEASPRTGEEQKP